MNIPILKTKIYDFLCRNYFLRYILNRNRFKEDQRSNKILIISVLSIPPTSETDSKNVVKLYKLYWFAEQLQYYNLKLVLVNGMFKKHQEYLLDGAMYAVFQLYYTFDEYFKECIKSPERALIRKSIKNGFICKPIKYDDYLKDIIEINHSKAIRQGTNISDDYKNVLHRDCLLAPYTQGLYSFGCFSPKGNMIAYFTFESISNFIHVVKAIAHSDYLTYGVMNHLFAFSISELSRMFPNKTLVYGPISFNKNDGFSNFRRNIGCKPAQIVLRGKLKDVNQIMRFNAKYHLYGDTAVNFVLDYVRPSLETTRR